MKKLTLGFILCYFLVCFSSRTLSRTANNLSPVIFIPGDGGSQIEAKLSKPSVVHYLCTQTTTDYFDLWLNMELLVPYVIDCWIDNMRLVYDNITRTSHNSPGVVTRIPGFGNSTTVEWLDPSMRFPSGYFKDIGNALVNLGYERGVTLKGAPFDFRKAPNEHKEYFGKLRELIEDTFYETGERVTLVAHSMGAPMMMYFLPRQKQAWRDRHIQALVTLSGAWGGSVKAVKVYAAGDNLGIYVLNVNKVREEQRTMPSLAFLMPSQELWGPEEVLVQTPTHNFTSANLTQFLLTLNLSSARDMYDDTRQINMNSPPPGVELHCLHGVGLNTVERLNYPDGKFPDNPTVIYGDGDGTVNVRSAEMCLKWDGVQKQRVFHRTFPQVDHNDMLRNSAVVEYVVGYLNATRIKNARRNRVQNSIWGSSGRIRL